MRLSGESPAALLFFNALNLISAQAHYMIRISACTLPLLLQVMAQFVLFMRFTLNVAKKS